MFFNNSLNFTCKLSAEARSNLFSIFSMKISLLLDLEPKNFSVTYLGIKRVSKIWLMDPNGFEYNIFD